MEPRLIKIDRNGSKHYEGLIPCDRCNGVGIFYIGVCNGQPVPSPVDNGVCFKCFGTGKVEGKWIERTPEYEAKLEARRAAKRAKQEEEMRAERERIEAERQALEAERAAAEAAEEARIKAQKAISQFVGSEGERITCKATFDHSAYWDTKLGWQEIRMYAHTFRDENGNVLVWKTQCCDNRLEEGVQVILTGTIKRHNEYKDEKQTELQRCKLEIC